MSASKMWKGGKHVNSHLAGNDLSLEIQAAPHGKDVLDRYEQVGELAERKEDVDIFKIKEPPALIALVLSKHPHPVSVHFPIALSITSALFIFLALILKTEFFEVAAICNLVVATLAAPGSIGTGLLSWYYNYQGVWTFIYRSKAMLSVLLVVLQITALLIYFLAPGGSIIGEAWHLIYSLIVLSLAPIVMGLGFLGGKITFPS